MIMMLFFTRGVSLKDWVDAGLFEREKKIYESHLDAGFFDTIFWLTYGSQDLEIAQQLKKEGRLHASISICQMPSFFNVPGVGSWVYSFLLPFIHRKELAASSVLKTNQIDGSWSAVISKLLFRKILIVRTGYTLSQLENKLKRLSPGRRKVIEFIERVAYCFSDAAIVSSRHNKEYLIEKYNIDAERIFVLYNYIDVSLFSPDVNAIKYANKIVYVGRLSSEKNLKNLILAISQTGLTLDVYGQGELCSELKSYAALKKAKVNFMGVVPNSELPKILNRYEYYILPSLYEGMPKTLLEAMACGLVCIGTNVSGINEVIIDGVNGRLAATIESHDLLEKIKEVKRSDNSEMVKQAGVYIKNNFSLTSIAQSERDIFCLTISSKRSE